MSTDHWQGPTHQALPPAPGYHPFPPPWQPFPAPPPAQPPSRSRLPLVIGAGVAGFVALVGGTAFALASGVERTLTVEVDFYDSAVRNMSNCQGGDGGYSDIGPGMPITVRDGENDILASASLPATGRQQDEGRHWGCIWTVQVQVPAGEDHYVVDMGERGTVPFTPEELAANDWVAEVGIGN